MFTKSTVLWLLAAHFLPIALAVPWRVPNYQADLNLTANLTSLAQTPAECRKARTALQDPENLEPFPIPDTDLTLEFFNPGPLIPAEELVDEVISAIEAVGRQIKQKSASTNISDGLFIHRLRWKGIPDVVATHLCDFNQLGRPMTLGTVGHVLRGLALWIDTKKLFQEMHFNVLVDGVGLVGFGYTLWTQEPISPAINPDVAPPTAVEKRWAILNESVALNDITSKIQCNFKTQPTIENLVPYHRQGFRTSLELYDFGEEVPQRDLFGALVQAIDLATEKGRKSGMYTNIADGMFTIVVRFPDGRNITTSVCDMDMVGRPMVWKDVTEAIRGEAYYMNTVTHVFQVMSFHVIDPKGYLIGFGSTKLSKPPVPIPGPLEVA